MRKVDLENLRITGYTKCKHCTGNKRRLYLTRLRKCIANKDCGEKSFNRWLVLQRIGRYGEPCSPYLYKINILSSFNQNPMFDISIQWFQRFCVICKYLLKNNYVLLLFLTVRFTLYKDRGELEQEGYIRGQFLCNS